MTASENLAPSRICMYVIYIVHICIAMIYKNSLWDKNVCANHLKRFHHWGGQDSWAPHDHFRHLRVKPQGLVVSYWVDCRTLRVGDGWNMLKSQTLKKNVILGILCGIGYTMLMVFLGTCATTQIPGTMCRHENHRRNHIRFAPRYVYV